MDYAEATCVLKVNIHCQACKMGILEVLNSICGAYNVDISCEEGLVRVYGLVDPEMLMRALVRTGYHAELKWVKLRHPNMARNYRHYDDSPYEYGYHRYDKYGSIDDPYRRNRVLLTDPGMTHPCYQYGSDPYYYTGMTHPYYQYGSDPYYYTGMTHIARYVPSYPPYNYDDDPYDDDSVSLCSVM
ncbi:hypothetical protein M569_05797 [Genlisea aurea]|uniref:HMA domain-containing protein n=1 Tax=Genlisea aurea TaxID=192259 RepID=S8CP93_9LAMI|nr:hypothetical protein M569_05797 [Genlisea aurea]